jgi:hypothetical protein
MSLVSQDTNLFEGHFAAGVVAFTQRRAREAFAHFTSAAAAGADSALCASYRWQCSMLLGDFEQAWRESDDIASLGRAGSSALWDGSPFAGRVVIRCLHGYGDAIQFLRYASLVRETAAVVIIETHPEMVALLRCFPGVDSVVTWNQPESLRREDWDQQIEVMELPHAFRTTLANIPGKTPYIHIPSDSRVSCRC